MNFEIRARKKEKVCWGDFEIKYLDGNGSDFDIGGNCFQCGNLKFVKEYNGEEFALYICMSDIVLSDALRWVLIRTQTLVDGCKYCDFRFKKGADTQITSASPQVQEVIDRIENQKV